MEDRLQHDDERTKGLGRRWTKKTAMVCTTSAMDCSASSERGVGWRMKSRARTCSLTCICVECLTCAGRVVMWSCRRFAGAESLHVSLVYAHEQPVTRITKQCESLSQTSLTPIESKSPSFCPSRADLQTVLPAAPILAGGLGWDGRS
jgi:hypothetical protein